MVRQDERLTLGVFVHHEDGAVEAPMIQILYRSRPYHLVATAVHRYQVVVRTIDIHALLAGLVRILKHVGFAVGDMLPEGQIGVTHGDEFRRLGLLLVST